MKLLYTIIAILLFSNFGAAQKKIMDEEAYDIWNRISKVQISDSGNFVTYELGPEDKDGQLKIYYVNDKTTFSFERGSKAQFLENDSYIAFRISPPKDSIRAMKKRKVKKEDLPKDTLAIYSTQNKHLEKIPNLKSFETGEEWGSHLVYQLAPFKKEKKEEQENNLRENKKNEVAQDSLKKKKKIKKESDKNGSKLIVRNISNNSEDTLHFVTQYKLAKKEPGIAAISTGKEKHDDHVSVFDFNIRNWNEVLKARGKFSQLNFSDDGKQLCFVADLDTTKTLVRPIELFHWKNGNQNAKRIADQNTPFLPKEWTISKDNPGRFTDDGSMLKFEIKPPEVLQDTSLLDDEIVNVEVWNYKDGYLHTQQKVNLPREKKRGYDVLYKIDQNRFTQLENLQLKEVMVDRVTEKTSYIGIDNSKYLQNISWLGYANSDVYRINPKKANKKLIASNIDGRARVSPHGNYAYWYSKRDTSWMIYDLKKDKLRIATDNSMGNFYDETNDRPMLPRTDGFLGWNKNDQAFYIYDGYDVWKVNPKKEKDAKRVTKFREKKTRVRYLRLDNDEKFIDDSKTLLFYAFNEEDKSSAYLGLDLQTGSHDTYVSGDYRFSTRPMKAKNSNEIVFTKENFKLFPDLLISDNMFKSVNAISDANPQQKDYRWGDIELVNWTATDGQKLNGLLVKPDGFDPTKKYPLLVNFYERSSDGLHRHHTPAAGRSSINYSFYASKGYVIFNPDVIYTNGYPGKSCENAVLSGIEEVLKNGYIDEERIGIQGHSWGGYQVAHLLTKTDIFKCAESGAPVVNMVSAYGGIRWGSGMSRAFQYEKTQSRLGATLWERPDLYLENSPIFNTDKVTTPVLILHNDKDGAVPWYQGIEYFVALRRLGKPAWMLNYNDEPHWPVKRQNRVDFQTRMAQFFDYYLMDAPMPVWMDQGVSAMDKGINQGLELIKEDGN